MAKIFTPCDLYVVISKCSHWLKSRHESSSFPIRAIAASRVISAYSGKFMVLVGGVLLCDLHKSAARKDE
jgi:hypothetical protein